MKEPLEKRLGTGRVAFLARIGTFKEMIEAGHTMKMVYELHQAELGISYSQFVNYANRFIRMKPKNEPEKIPVPAIETKAKERSIVVEPSIKEFKRSEKRDDLFKPKS